MSRTPAHPWDARCPAPRAPGASGAGRPRRRLGSDATPGERTGLASYVAGRYVPAGVDGSSPEQRVMEQAARLTPHGAVTGWAALRLWGAGFFDGVEPDGVTRVPVPLALGSEGAKVRDSALSSVSREPLATAEVVLRHGIACTRVARAVPPRCDGRSTSPAS